mmetsp:Transcript_17445/g.37029  ORF Transcript_17445/g.37029 Transcript_17445/m.37029 type:complete len:186 (+) Transcript_17445:20-577(+)
MLTAALAAPLAWAPPLIPSRASPLRLASPPFSRRAPPPSLEEAASLREQMAAYLRSAKDRGVELSEEQRRMIAEFEADDALLDQRGLVDFSRASAAPPLAGAAPPPVPSPAPPPAPSPTPSPAPPSVVADVDAASARLWLMQERERGAAVSLLRERVGGGSLPAAERAQLRKSLSALIYTLTTAG